MLNFVFLGCHHDDIELGAGILTQRALAANYKVSWVILTDDQLREDRRHETFAAAAELGVLPDHIHFAGLPDGDLRVDGATIGLLRDLDLQPDVVVTHTGADSHNDHRAANELAFSTFREAIVLQYPIHISARSTDFSPRFFVAQSEEHLAHKEQALGSHVTQHDRIAKRDRTEFEKMLGELAGLRSAEAFELSVQVGGEGALNELMTLNDSAFHSFWYPLIEDRTITLLYEAFLGQPAAIEEYSRQEESVGRDVLRAAFARHWFPRSPLAECFSSDPAVDVYLAEGDVLLAGSLVNNPVTGRVLNPLPEIRWVIEHDAAREDVFLYDKRDRCAYRPLHDSGGGLRADLAVFSIVPSPVATGRTLISCAGIHGLGTQGLLEFLANPRSNKWLRDLVVQRSGALNLPVEVDATDRSLYMFTVSSARGRRISVP
jgi:LmbE family N-acetylglucosaminyl deacetylase